MGLFSSKSKSRSATAPWWGAEGTLRNLSSLSYAASKTPLEYFPDQTYAGQTEAERQAIEQLRTGAGAYGGIMGETYDPALGAYQSALGAPESVMGMGLQDVASNPYLAAVSEAIQSRVNRNLQENILPGLSLAGAAGGGLGGTRQGVAEGIAGRGTSEALTEQLANLYGGAWQAGLGAETTRLGQALSARQGAMGMAPGMAQLGLSQYTQPAALLGQAGRLERAEEQRAIDEQMARHQFEQMEPWQRLQLGFGTIMPAATAFGMTESQEKINPSTIGQIGQLVGLAGAAGGTLMGGFGGLGGPTAPRLVGGMADPWGAGGVAINPYQLTANYANPYQAAPTMPANIGGGTQFDPWMWGGA